MLQLSLSHKKFSGVVEGLILIHCSAILMGLVGVFKAKSFCGMRHKNFIEKHKTLPLFL